MRHLWPLLDAARKGNRDEVQPTLERLVAGIHNTSTGGRSSVEENLLTEALDYARLGDMDECAHRLRLLVEPKFHSIAHCEQVYGTPWEPFPCE